MASRFLLFKEQRNTLHSANPRAGKAGNVQVRISPQLYARSFWGVNL